MSFEMDTEAMLMEYPQDQEENEYRYIDAGWLDKVAAGLTAGAKKHPNETWKEIPPEEHAARAIRHLNMFRKGDRSEEHLINASMRCMMASVLADGKKDITWELSECPRCGGKNYETPFGLHGVMKCSDCGTCWLTEPEKKKEIHREG